MDTATSAFLIVLMITAAVTLIVAAVVIFMIGIAMFRDVSLEHDPWNRLGLIIAGFIMLILSISLIMLPLMGIFHN